MAIIYNVFLAIDGLMYDVIDWLFGIFDFLAKLNLFSNKDYNDIVNSVYVVLGLIMLFVLAYSLLKAVINPDEFSKGENSFPKLIKNVVVSLAIIAVLPTVFTVAFNIQNSILNQDTIPQLVLGDNFDDGIYNDAGRTIAYNSFSAFFHVNEEWCKTELKKEDMSSNLSKEELVACEVKITTNSSNVKWYKPWRIFNSEDNFNEIRDSIMNGNISIANFNQFGEAVAEGKLSYIMILSTIYGFVLLWVIANFCFDMATRVIKLMFFQIIAPIPVVCRVIPGGKMKDVFPTWVKKTVSTFFDVFIRIFVLYLGEFLIIKITEKWGGISQGTLSNGQFLIAEALVIMGVVVFMRQAPKLIGEMFHLDLGIKLGLRDHLKEGGFFAAAGAVGSLVTSRGNPLAALRGLKHGWNNANFHNIGAESMRRRARRDARAQGATNGQIFADSIRRAFGFESTTKADDYAIANRVYTVRDQNGNLIELTPERARELETEKYNNSTQIAAINSATSRQRDISSENAIVINARGTFKNDGLDDIHKADSEIKEKLDIVYSEEMRKADLTALDDEYTTPGSTMTEAEYNARKATIENKQMFSLVGNYNSLKAQLEQNYKKGLITDEVYNQAALDLAKVEKSMQEKFVTAASKEAGQRIYTNYDGSTIAVDDGGKFNTNYQKLINDLEAGVLKDVDGNTISLNSFVDGNGNQLEGWDLINAAFKIASGINNEIGININNSEREKRTIEQANKAIDAIFEQRTKMQEQAKNENTYKAHKVASEYNDNNAPKK